MHLEEVNASCAGPDTAGFSATASACAKGEQPKPRLSAEQVRLRLLRCTAEAMVSSPGGLRFVSNAKPWLEGLAGGQAQRKGQRPVTARPYFRA